MNQEAERLRAAKRLFLDTAPVIYYVEENPRYLPLIEDVFTRLDDGSLNGSCSPAKGDFYTLTKRREMAIISSISSLCLAVPCK